ncbi:MAG: alpha/beta hydrolase [Chitinophagaceae bacterium]|nr:MAG: alpha/beta hydrolase [Chitinophagaceae bacterium]
MKSLIITIMLTGMFTTAFAQDSTILYLWPGTVPGETVVKHPPKITDNHQGNVTRLTDVTNPSLTVFLPKANRRNGAAVLVCPGGGYSILAINLEGYEIAHWLNHLGFAAFVLEYRVPDDRAGALQDAQRAMRVIQSRAKEWNLNPEKIGVMGFSAGGSLSARISTEYAHNWYSPVDRADSFSSRPGFAVLIYPAYLDEGPDHSLTPELKIHDHTPPMFIFQTADDPYGNSSLVMAAALRNAKAPFELHIYPKGHHGYGLRKGNPAAEEWPPLAAKWLEKQIKK